MPIEYEMMVLKQTVEDAIHQFSEENYAATWLDDIEDSVLHMVEDTPDAPKFFKEYQLIAMRELISRGYWIKWDAELGRSILTKINR
jgi:hypothetical protein